MTRVKTLEVIQDLHLCQDCAIAACNDDYSGMDDDQEKATRKGLHRLQSDGGYLAANYTYETGDGIQEFSTSGCDCCLSPLAGERTRFAILGYAKD